MPELEKSAILHASTLYELVKDRLEDEERREILYRANGLDDQKRQSMLKASSPYESKA